MPQRRATRTTPKARAGAEALETQNRLALANALRDLAGFTLDTQRQVQRALVAVHQLLESIEGEARVLEASVGALEERARLPRKSRNARA